ncbi:MAG TPA: ISL3 family transposase [Propionibacteriaceae bacterium]|nr:ISL3 family transposase [Propionibacteriaceae bacterium]
MSDATSVDATSVLFGLEDEFRVLDVQRIDQRTVMVIIEQTAREGPCPACGVITGVVKDRPVMCLRDLPASGQRVQLRWRKRRLVCAEALCSRQTFTQASTAVRPRARVTERLRAQVATAIASSNRAVSDVAGEYGVSWPTAHKALVAAAARWLPAPTPTSRLGIDETRFQSVRWILDGVTWKRSDPWLTSFVDCSRDGPGSLLGLAPGRTGGCVRDWLGEQTDAFRKRIEIVIIDPSAPYASGIRAALPDALIAVDGWHLVALANQMVTEVRQRVTRDQLGRRGTVADPVWVNRRLLLTGADHLSAKQSARLSRMLHDHDPTNEIGAAWGVKERLRMLLKQREPSKIRCRPADFYDAAIDAQMAETTRLAKTIQAWWPAILVALTHDVSNARTEGFNRVIKQTKRVGCGYRNMNNYQRRILSHIAVTRPQRSAA